MNKVYFHENSLHVPLLYNVNRDFFFFFFEKAVLEGEEVEGLRNKYGQELSGQKGLGPSEPSSFPAFLLLSEEQHSTRFQTVPQTLLPSGEGAGAIESD